MSTHFQRHSSGFTLIEVVIVIAIISIVSTIVVTSLSTSRAAREADRGSRTFAAALREAQGYALAGRGTVIGQENCFYGLRITSATTYSLVNYYRSGGNCASSNTLSTTTLPSGVQFAGIVSYPTVFAFALPRADVSMTTNNSPPVTLGVTQMIGLIKNSQTMYICLYPTGRIEERGATASCP